MEYIDWVRLVWLVFGIYVLIDFLQFLQHLSRPFIRRVFESKVEKIVDKAIKVETKKTNDKVITIENKIGFH